MERTHSTLSKNPLGIHTKGENWDLDVNYPRSQHKCILSENKTLPYLNFFKKGNTDRDIINWPSKILPKLSQVYEKLPLNKKGEVRKNMIANEFGKYWANLGEDVNPETIEMYSKITKEIFSVEIDLDISCAICLIIEELLCVPEDIALAACQSKASTTAAIKRQIKRDISMEKKKMSLVGFGTSLLPKDMFRPPINNTEKNWNNLKHIPTDIESMTNIWEGITGLTSTRGYYEWLKNHPDRPVPAYLKNHCFDDTKTDDNQILKQNEISPTLPDALLRRKPKRRNVCR